MSTNLERYRTELTKLMDEGRAMLGDLHPRHRRNQGTLRRKEDKEVLANMEGTFDRCYQGWFSEASAVIKQLLPDRHDEFIELYRSNPRRRSITLETYSIQDWLNGMRIGINQRTGEKFFDDFAGVTMRLTTQVEILKSAERRFESSLFDIRQLVQADLFDSELEAARVLATHGFQRAAGAISGVVLEKHLGQVASNHSLTVRKKRPGIFDWNEALKEARVVDIPGWRQVQRLAAIRNLCDHDQREPTDDEIQELIAGVDKLTKTLF